VNVVLSRFGVMLVAVACVCGTASADSKALLQEALVAGLEETVQSVYSSVTVMREDTVADEDYVSVQLANATRGNTKGAVVRPAPKREFRMWVEGDKFRLEAYGIATDGELREERVFMCDGLHGAMYTRLVPEGMTGGVGYLMSPEQLWGHLDARQWNLFFDPLPQHALADAEAAGWKLSLPSDAPKQISGATTYALDCQHELGTTRLSLAPALGFLPVKNALFGLQGELICEARVEKTQVFDGVVLPTRWTQTRYQDGTPVTTTDIEVLEAQFNRDIPDEVFAISFPGDIRVRDSRR